MYIVTRRINEALVIGQNLKVRIVGVKGQQVRIGIEAPRNVPVHRAEIADRIAADAEEETNRRGTPGR
jgi:carbon storage regulator